ncbi:hypothetical protein CR513_37086, partial [Mucuna pruriens]
MQIGTSSVDFSNFVEIPYVMNCFNFVEDVCDSVHMFSQAQPAIRSPGREPLGQAETRPMQGA